MAGWRKGDGSSKAKPSVSAPKEDLGAVESPTPSSTGGGWRKDKNSEPSSKGTSTQGGWRPNERRVAKKAPPSKRRFLLALVGLAFLFFAAWFLDLLWNREQLIEVVLYQRGTDSSQLDTVPLGLMPLSQQWSRADRRNCRITTFDKYKDAEGRKSPLLLVVQAVVDAKQIKSDLNAILKECLNKIRDKSSMVVVLDLLATPESTPLISYSDPTRGLGQYSDFYPEVLAVWEELNQSAEVKSSGKKLMLLVASSAKGQAWGAPELDGSALQNFVIDALSSEEADANRDYRVTLDELEKFVGQRVADWVKARRAAVQTPKLLVMDQGERSKVLYRRYADNWINRYLGRRKSLPMTGPTKSSERLGVATVQQNWNKIDDLWLKYEDLLQARAYRWSPERLSRIAQGLMALEHFAERADVQQQEAAKQLLKTVELELQECAKTPPSRIDFESLGVDIELTATAAAELEKWAAWQGGLPRFLADDNGSVSNEAGTPTAAAATPVESAKTAVDPPSNPSAPQDTASKDAPSKDAADLVDDKKPNFGVAEQSYLVWHAARNFPLNGEPVLFSKLTDAGLSRIDASSLAPTNQLLKLLRSDSHWYKAEPDWDTPTKTRFGQTLGPSLKTIHLWLQLVFTDRRPDAMVKFGKQIEDVTTAVQNQLVDRWFAGPLPEDSTIGDLQERLQDLQNRLTTWEAALDARDEYYLFRPYLITWLAAASEFADENDQNQLEQLTKQIKDFDGRVEDFVESSDQAFAEEVASSWNVVLDRYSKLAMSKLPVDGSMPSEESFVWLRLTRNVPVVLNSQRRRELREKMGAYIAGKSDIDVGQGDVASTSDLSQRKVENERRGAFLHDLSGKFPLETLTRLGDVPNGDAARSRWLRSPKSIYFEAVYEQPAKAVSAGDRGVDIWKGLVANHSLWLQTLVLQRMTWGDGNELISGRRYFERLAAACRPVDGSLALSEGTDSGSSESLRTVSQEVILALQKFSFDVEGGEKRTYEASELPNGVLQYPVKLNDARYANWGEVGELSCWVDASGSEAASLAFQATAGNSSSFLMDLQAFVPTGLQGDLVGSFRGNRFGQKLIRLPASREFVESSLQRNTSPARLIVQGINAPTLNVVFAIDCSKSMNQAAPPAEAHLETRLNQAREILRSSIELLQKQYLEKGIVRNVKIGIVYLNDKISKRELVDIREFNMAGFPDEGSGNTKLVDGYQAALELLANKVNDECLVVGITDGMDTSDGGTKAKDFDVFLRSEINGAKHVQCLLLQAASEATFVQEMVQEVKDDPRYSVEKTDSHWREQWRLAQSSLAALQKNTGGKFRLYSESEINSKNMMNEIDKILPGTVVTIRGTVPTPTDPLTLKQVASLPNAMMVEPSNFTPPVDIAQWSAGIGGWEVAVNQRNRRIAESTADRTGMAGKYGPFSVWGGENVRLVFDQQTGTLYRQDNDARPEVYQEMLGLQWLAPRLLEDRDGLVVNIDFGCDQAKPVDRPELVFVELVQSGTKLPVLCDFRYELSYDAQHTVRTLPLPDQWVVRKTASEKVSLDHRIWTVRRSQALQDYYLPTIEPISAATNDGDVAKLGEAWQGENPPQVTVKRSNVAASKREQIEIFVNGENATEWFVALVGNVWKDVSVKVATDKTWVRKTYKLAEGFEGQPVQALLISRSQLQQAVEGSSTRQDGLVEVFEFGRVLESSR
jgi:hypothetical protein